MDFLFPTAVTLPIAVFAWLLLALRLARFRDTLVDRRYNILLAMLAEITTTHEPTLRQLLSDLTGGLLSNGLIYQFGAIGFMFTVAASLLLAAAMFGHTQPAAVVYGLAAVSSLVALLFDGLAHGPDPDAMYLRPGWGQLGFWLALAPMTYWMVCYLGGVCAIEMRKRQHDRRERTIHAMVLGTACSVFAVTSLNLIAAVQRGLGRQNWVTDLHLVIDHNAVFVQILPFFGIATVPVLTWLIDAAGLDLWSRRRKRLLPLWFDLTAACPEIVHRASTPDGPQRSRYFLHRTVIEIRDSLLLLSRYASPTPASLRAEIAAATRSDPERAALDLAVRMVRACAAKTRGDMPTGTHSLQHNAGNNLAEESAELAAVAAQWSRARALVDGATEIRAT